MQFLGEGVLVDHVHDHLLFVHKLAHPLVPLHLLHRTLLVFLSVQSTEDILR